MPIELFPLRCRDFNLEGCGCPSCGDDLDNDFEIYSPVAERYGLPNPWARICCQHEKLIKTYSQRQWTEAVIRRRNWLTMLDDIDKGRIIE